jgi:GDPmannose 4,6-dehydratase
VSAKTTIVTGITGQDGQMAARLLLEKGYRVIGTSRSGRGPTGLDVPVVAWDLIDPSVIEGLLQTEQPQELYNFAAFSSGAGMYDRPLEIGDINGLAVGRILEAIRAASPHTRFAQASSSELFGLAQQTPQNESTPFRPRSPYGAAKLYAHAMIDIYRERYGVFACSAILYNHESPLRGPAFVTRKIARAAAEAKVGRLERLSLGNLEARRDWGYAGDSVEAMWRMLQAEAPADYVVATGRTHSVRDLCACAFGHVGLDYRSFVTEDPDAFRAAEPVEIVGDAGKAARVLGWLPKVGFEEMVRMMVHAELRAIEDQGAPTR